MNQRKIEKKKLGLRDENRWKTQTERMIRCHKFNLDSFTVSMNLFFLSLIFFSILIFVPWNMMRYFLFKHANAKELLFPFFCVDEMNFPNVILSLYSIQVSSSSPSWFHINWCCCYFFFLKFYLVCIYISTTQKSWQKPNRGSNRQEEEQAEHTRR